MSLSMRGQLMALRDAVTQTKPPRKTKRVEKTRAPIIAPASVVTIPLTMHDPRVIRANSQTFHKMAKTPLKRGTFNRPDPAKKPDGINIGTRNICERARIYGTR